MAKRWNGNAAVLIETFGIGAIVMANDERFYKIERIEGHIFHVRCEGTGRTTTFGSYAHVMPADTPEAPPTRTDAERLCWLVDNTDRMQDIIDRMNDDRTGRTGLREAIDWFITTVEDDDLRAVLDVTEKKR
jgi:hypothetical protein